MPNYDALKISPSEILTPEKWNGLVEKVEERDQEILSALTIQDANVGIGTQSPNAKLHLVGENSDANGNTLVIGPTNQSNLRLGVDREYSWIQSHYSKPLSINPKGNNVGIGTTNPKYALEVVDTIKSKNIRCNYLIPEFTSDNYDFIRLGEENKHFAGLMLNKTTQTYGTPNSLSIFTYGNRDINLVSGSGVTNVYSRALVFHDHGRRERFRVDQNGLVHSQAGFRFPDGTIQRNAVHIQSGSMVMHTGGWQASPLGRGTGSRSHHSAYIGLSGFSATPHILVAVETLDVDKDQNYRFSASAVNASKSRFRVRFSTWSDTKIYGCRVRWIAIGR